jgi:hypothetical protein
MKLKLVSLGLLALAPMAAQAELVEMQDAEMADVNGQGFSWGGSVSAGWTGTVAGYDLSKSFAASKSQYCPEWSVTATKGVTSTYSGRWYEKSIEAGVDHGTKYISPSFSWGRNPVSS